MSVAPYRNVPRCIGSCGLVVADARKILRIPYSLPILHRNLLAGDILSGGIVKSTPELR